MIALQVFPPPPLPTLTVLAGQTATFTGNIAGFLGYTSPVNLSCQNGSPRVPNICPGSGAQPDGVGNNILFNFPVSDTVAGTYTFDIVAVGTDPQHITKTQHVQLNISDFAVDKPLSDIVNVLSGFTSPSMNIQIEGLGGFNGFANLSCMGVPVGAQCLIFPNFVNFFPGGPTSQSVALVIDSGSAAPAIYPIQFQASTFSLGFLITRSLPLTLRLLPADHLTLSTPATAVPGSPVSVTVSTVDQNGNPMTHYTGTVHFTSTDANASLPSDYQFSGFGGDNGVHSFPNVTFNKVGPRTLTVNDTSPFGLQVTSAIVKVDTANPNDSIALNSSRTTVAPPHFRDEIVTFTAMVTGATSPPGLVRFFDGARDLGTATLVPSGPGKSTASLTVNRLGPGGHIISAAYEGGGGFAANLSLDISQPRSPAPRCQPNQCP